MRLRRQLLLIHSCHVHVVTEIVAVLTVQVVPVVALRVQVVLLALVAKVALAAWVEADLPVVISPDNERTERLK